MVKLKKGKPAASKASKTSKTSLKVSNKAQNKLNKKKNKDRAIRKNDIGLKKALKVWTNINIFKYVRFKKILKYFRNSKPKKITTTMKI